MAPWKRCRWTAAFDWIMQNRKDKHTALKRIDAYALPSHPKVADEVLK
jgi:hypothetical protein